MFEPFSKLQAPILLTMKQILLLSLGLLLLSAGCKKNRNKNPVDELPPATQNGANTFGCLIDGKVFKPKGNPFGGPVIKAQYQFVNGRQGFGISGSRSDGNESKVIGIIGDSIRISVDSFEITNLDHGKFRGGYSYMNLTMASPVQYETNEINRGQLKITKFDTINQIVSGTFWFDAIDSATGKIVQIREGRFDLFYVRLTSF